MSFEFRLFSAISDLDRLMASKWLELAIYQSMGENMEEVL